MHDMHEMHDMAAWPHWIGVALAAAASIPVFSASWRAFQEQRVTGRPTHPKETS